MNKEKKTRYLFGIIVTRITLYGEDEEIKQVSKILYTTAVSDKQAINNIRHKYKFFNWCSNYSRIEYNFKIEEKSEIL